MRCSNAIGTLAGIPAMGCDPNVLNSYTPQPSRHEPFVGRLFLMSQAVDVGAQFQKRPRPCKVASISLLGEILDTQ